MRFKLYNISTNASTSTPRNNIGLSLNRMGLRVSRLLGGEWQVGERAMWAQVLGLIGEIGSVMLEPGEE